LSTFLGLLSGGRPPAQYETYYLDGLGADTTTKKKVSPKKVAAKKPAAKKKAAAPKKVAVKVKVKGGLRHAPLDRHRNPYKRSNIRPGVPHEEDSEFTQRETQRSDTWSCEWKAPYRQLCTMVGVVKKDGTPRTKLIKLKKEYKQRYNKAYHKHLKKLGKPKFTKNEKDDLYSFRETEWQKSNQPKGRTKKAAPKKASSKKAPAKKATPAKKKSRAKATA